MSVNNTVDSTRFDGRGAALAGEERLDLVEHAVGVPGEPHVVVAVELHQLRACRIRLTRSCACSPTHVAVATPVQQQVGAWMLVERGADVGAHEYVVASP